jgi:transporter family protein
MEQSAGAAWQNLALPVTVRTGHRRIWVCYFRALQIGNASQVAPVDKFSLVLVALFAVAFLGERPSPREWAGIGLVAAGVLTLAIKR